MEKKISAIIFVLVAIALAAVEAGGTSSPNVVSSYGTIEYPSRTNNLIVPFGQARFGPGLDWDGYAGYLNNYAFLDNVTYHGENPSMKLLADPNGITPGDPALWSKGWALNSSVNTVVIAGWVKASSGQVARMACDFRDSNGLILDNYGVGPPQTGNWTSTSEDWEFISLTYYDITSTNATSVCLWIQNVPVRSGNYSAACWFDSLSMIITYG
jgi:hypothetical protein